MHLCSDLTMKRAGHPKFKDAQPAFYLKVASLVVMRPRQTLHNIPRHLTKPQHLAALRLYMRIGRFAAGEGGEVGFVHGAAGF